MEKGVSARLIQFGWTVSLLGFMVVLGIIYASLPLQVQYYEGPKGINEMFINKSSFFYISTFTFLAINLICYLSRRTIKSVKTSKQSLIKNEWFKEALGNWITSFSMIINLFLILILLFLNLLNTQDADIANFGYIAYAGPVLIIIWMVILLGIIFKNK